MERINLYIGSSMGDLNKMAEYNFDPSRSTKIHINHSDKTLQAAEAARLKGDEERAYILYMRYLDIFKKVHSSRDFKKDAAHYSLLLGTTKMIQALEHAEKLSKNLKKRYEEKISSPVDKENETKSLNGVVSPKLSGPVVSKDKAPAQKIVNGNMELVPTEATSISTEKLYELLFGNRNASIKTLMLDIRVPEEFKSSCIRHPNCINVPKTFIKPGGIVKHIEQGITNIDHLGEWRNRAEADFIVMIDWYASEKRLEDVQDPLRSLKDALHKWEQEIFLKREPLVLAGGYADWLDYYPQFTSNPKVERPAAKTRSVTTVEDLTKFSFHNLLELEPEKKDTEEQKEDDDTEENWENAEILEARTKTEKPRTDNTILGNQLPKSTAADFVSSMNLYPEVPKDLNIGRTSKERSVDRETSDLEIAKKDTANIDIEKKNVPSVDRATKPKIPSRDLKPQESKKTPTSQTASGAQQNLENWPPKFTSDDNIFIESPPTPKEDDEIIAIQRNIEAIRKKKEEDERKTREIREKRLAAVRAQEQRLLLEAKEKERGRKLAEKELADSLRMLSKPGKKTIPSDIATVSEMDANQSTMLETKVLEEKMTDQATKQQKAEDINSGIARDKTPAVPPITVVKNKPSEDPKKIPTPSMPKEPKPERVDGDKTKSKSISPTSSTPVIPPKNPAKPIIQSSPTTIPVKDSQASNVKVPKDPPIQPKSIQPVVQSKPIDVNAAAKPSGTVKKTSQVTPVPSVTALVKPKENSKKQPKQQQQKTVPRELPRLPDSTDRMERTGSSTLPVNWEKKLDRSTGRYYYLNHKNKTTHWQLPEKVITDQRKKVPLKDSSAPSGGSLKRSHSTPDIAQLVENEELKPARPDIPNRSIKPSFVSGELPDVIDEYAHHLPRLHPMPGGSGPGLCGLQNLGNTCYMNSVLQCMFNTTHLIEYFLQNLYKGDINRQNFLGSGGEITDGFATLMKTVWDGNYKYITPRDFRFTVSKFNPRFGGYIQQDSQELLLFLMDGLHEDLNRITKRQYIEEADNDELHDEEAAKISWAHHKRLNESIIVELFQGQFKATVQCLTCKKGSRKFDVFMYLSLPLPSQDCKIDDCIRNFSKVEKLSGDNKWRCPRCKTERDAVRNMVIWKLPPVLLIHFKRFSFSGRWKDKLQTSVEFPARGLDLSAHVHGPRRNHQTRYELYAVSHHHGASLDSGHYVASCKNPMDKQWYKFDDHEVYKTSKPQGPSAYILCYTSFPHALSIKTAK